MGRLRGRIKKAEREARGDLDSFLLLDGILHAYHLGLGRVEEPPELYRMLTRAQDPVEVLERLKPGSAQAFVDPSSLYDYDALVHERRLVPIVAPEPEDLSEGA
jgi:hypothetical protein